MRPSCATNSAAVAFEYTGTYAFTADGNGYATGARFNVDLVARALQTVPADCQIGSVVALRYAGSQRPDGDDAIIEGSGRVGDSRTGSANVRTENERLHVFCPPPFYVALPVQAVSGTTTIEAGGHRAVVTYGATTCETGGATWTVDGVPAGALDGVRCAVPNGGPRGGEFAGLAWIACAAALVARRRRTAARAVG